MGCTDLTAEQEVEMLRIPVGPWQCVVENRKFAPADRALHILQGLPLPDKDAQCPAVKGIVGLKLTDSQ